MNPESSAIARCYRRCRAADRGVQVRVSKRRRQKQQGRGGGSSSSLAGRTKRGERKKEPTEEVN